MKRIYLCAIALSVGTLSFGQAVKQNTNPFRTQSSGDVMKSITKAPRDKGATLWSDDFSTPANWVMTNSSSPAADWVITTDVNGTPAGAGLNPVGLTTGANGYALIDSDTPGGAATQDATITIGTPIDLTGQPNVSLIFEQVTRRWMETTTLRVSGNNGATWTDFIINNGMASNSNSPNPETISVNISAVAGGQSQVLVAFHYLGNFDWFWAIDDVEIQVTDNNDMVASDPFYGFGASLIQYTRIPVAQISAADFTMKTTNVGGVNQTNAILTADVNGGLFTGTSAPTTNNVGATDSLFSTTQYIPTATIGVPLNITLTLSSDSTDSTPGNNVMTFNPLEISNFVYAHDDYSTTPGNGGGYNNTPTPPTEDFEAGNYFDIIAPQTAYAIDVAIGSNTPAGAIIDVVLYELDAGGNFVQIDRSAVLVISAAEIGTVVSLTLPTTPALNAGTTYFAAVHGWGGTGSEFFYGTSGSSVNNSAPSTATSLIFYPSMSAPNAGENFFTTQTPMVRLNFDPNIGINEVSNNVNFNVYPNPSIGEFNINLNADISNNVNLTVKNVVVQTVINKTVAVSGKTKETISLADYSKGIYFLTIDNKTVKLIVE